MHTGYRGYRSALRNFVIWLILSLLVFLFGLNGPLVENAYSDHLYQYIAIPLRFVSALLPFSFGDLLYVVLIIFLIALTVKAYRALSAQRFVRMAWMQLGLRTVNLMLILYIAFKLLWGLNYSRPSITNRLGISQDKYNTVQLKQLSEFLIKRINAVQQQLKENPALKKRGYTLHELEHGAVAAYHDLAATNSFFVYRQPVLKNVLSNTLITNIGLEGYYCPVSGEANVNMLIPATEKPFVTCHEISHQLGIAREDEANLIGYLVATGSKDLNFQYSGYYNVLRNVLFEIRVKSPEDYQQILSTIDPAIIADYKADREFWSRYNGDMSAYMGTALDSFLKLNNQKKGIDSYQDIVIWLYNIHKKDL
ncbi:MAG: DUF3810 domain-containing protein [Pedobacter sp.]|nr:MAG: DUF3810 domain-containing protein [Pedobacter sp.]